MKRTCLALTIGMPLLFMALPITSQAGFTPLSTEGELVVSPQGPYTTLQAAIEDANPGATIMVRGGVYSGPLVVEKPVKLEGIDWPVIDGGGRGTVVSLNSPGIAFRGFEVRGSGVEPDRDHAGIILNAPQIRVEGNRLWDVLFGIFVAQADDSIVLGNQITSKDQYELGRKGDGIRLWYSARVRVEGNHVYSARDVVVWYSQDVVIRENLIEKGRYGVHLMYCDGAVIEGNRVLNNSVGIYAMYSNNILLKENDVRGQRGSSGYGLGFKDTDNAQVIGNVLVDNRAGMYLDGLPFSSQGYGLLKDNIVAFNDIGVILLPAVNRNHFERNTFWENGEQMAVQGSGQGMNVWKGNFWSDYTGFDAGSDGSGDTPYLSERLFENLTDREPRLRALLYSPAVQAIEMAASMFPVIRPQPKLADPAPRIQPAPIPAFANPGRVASSKMAWISIAITGSGVFGGLLAFVNRARPGIMKMKNKVSTTPSLPSDNVLISVLGVSKRYGKVKALERISFKVSRGESVGLWGVNGAGKTTLLKAILGLIDFQGEIRVGGYDVIRNGKLARSRMGYVPQEFAFYDATVMESIAFYARIKKISLSPAIEKLQQLGLIEHSQKRVSALSGGLRQRLALAIALIGDPPVLLLDEPLANLDLHARREYLSVLGELRRSGKTLVCASHRLEEVEALCDRMLIIEQGKLAEELSPRDLRSRELAELEMVRWN